MKTVAVVPVKRLRQAKTRLGEALSPEERAALTLDMLAHVLATLERSGVISRIGVISPSPGELNLPGSVTCVEQTRSGLNNHLEDGRRWALAQGADALMVIFADLPLLAPEDITAMVDLGRSEGTVVLAPDRHDRGTNAMLAHPVTLARFAFGRASLAKHQALAHRAGARLEIYRSTGTSLDVDTAADLTYLRARLGEDARLRIADCGLWSE